MSVGSYTDYFAHYQHLGLDPVEGEDDDYYSRCTTHTRHDVGAAVGSGVCVCVCENVFSTLTSV
jgi:hypothetical protein